MGSAGLANGAASAGDDGSASDDCFCIFLLMILASGFDADSAGFSVGDTCFCQCLLMMLVSGFDADSAWVFWW